MSEAVRAGLEAQSAALSLESPKTAFTAENLSNLGTIASQNGCFDLAENYYLQSISILKLLHGEDSVDVALATVPLAQMYGIYLNRFDDSIHLLERAMDVLVLAFDDQEDHPAVEEAREILERVYTALENTRPDSRATTRPSSRGIVEHMTTEAQSRPLGSVATPSTQANFTSDYFDLYDDNVSILSDDSLLRQKSVDGTNELGDVKGGVRRFNSTQLARELLELPASSGFRDNCVTDVTQSPLPLAVYSSLKSRPSSPEASFPQNPGAATVSMAEFENEMAEGGLAAEKELNQATQPQPQPKPQGDNVTDLSPALIPGRGSEVKDAQTTEPVPSSSSNKEKATKPQHTQLAKIKALSGVGGSPRTDGSSDPGTGRSEVDTTASPHDSRAGSKHSKSSSTRRKKPGRKKGDIEEDEDAPPPEVDDDLKQEIAQAKEELALHQTVQVFPVDHASFEEDPTHLNYSVEYLDLADFTDPAQARNYMCRGNEEAYAAAVGQTFAMPLFPPQIKEGGRYKPDFLQCARHVMSARIQRLMLEDQLRELRDRNQQFIDLYALCVKKKAAFHQRLLMLEGEMEHTALEKQGHLVSPGSRFGAFLSTKAGWVVVFEFLSRECKRLQLPEDKRALAGEVVNEHLTLEDVCHHWELMQTWQLLHSVFFRCKAGAKSYPIASKGPGGDPSKGIQKVEAHVEEDEGEKNVYGKPPPIINTDPSTSILAGQEAAARAAIDEVVEGGSVQDMLADDNSSIASRPSVARIKATEGGEEDDAASLASKASGKGSKTSGKSKNSKDGKEQKEHEQDEQDDKKKGGGSWGFGFSMFGKKEEAKVEVLATPVSRKLEPFVNGTGLGEWSEVCGMLGCPEGQVSLLAAARQVVSKLGAAGSAAGLHEAVQVTTHAPAQPSSPRSYSSSNPPPLGRILHGIIPLVLKSDIQMALESMSPTDETNPFLYNAMKQVLDAVADHLEKLMIESLRLFPKWAKALEVCRKDRIRRAGGRMDQNHDGEVEVDKHGTIRVIPHADDIVDTDILHGSRQRIQVTIVMPVLEQRIALAEGQESQLRGELACVVQFGYSEAAPFIQRIFRGTLARIRKARVRKDLVLYAMHAAVFTIQGMVRAKQGRRNFSQAKSEVIGDFRDSFCRVLQRNLRGWVKRRKFQRHKEDKRYRKWWFGLSMMQAIIRGFNARHRVRRLKAGNKEDQQKEEKMWNVELLQRVTRGYIARKTIVRSLRIRKSISKRVLLLAEQYLQRGDLWSFLKEIDDEFARLGKEINHTKQREDDFADTFIEKVLQKRQGEFDGAWDKFGRAVTAQSENRRAIENGQAPGVPGPSSSSSAASEYLTAVGAGNVTKAPRGGGAIRESEAGGEANIPGPLLRRAVSATVQEGVRSEIQRQRDGQDRGIKLAEKIKDAYNPNPSASASASASSSTRTGNKKQTNGKTTGNSLASKSLTSLPSSQAEASVNPKVRKELEDAIRIKKKKKSKQPQPNNLKATTENFLASAVSHDTGKGFAERNEAIAAQPVKGWKLDTTKAGESLLVDIPKGINDTMERLLRATALRCFVPEFFSGYDADSAYRMYLMLPPGLAKMRYEQEAFRYCQPAITQLRIKGVNLISEAMPPKRVRQFLASVKTPSKLLEKAMDYLFLLIKLGDVPVGLHHSPTMKKQSDLSEGKGTVAQAISAAASEATAAAAAADATASPDGKEGGGGSPSPPKPSWRREMSIKRSAVGKSKVTDALEAARAAVDGVGAQGGAQPFQPPNSSQSSRPAALAEEGDGDDGSDGERHNEVGDPTLPSRLLLDMVEHGPWASMTSSIDDIIMHAALLSVPTVQTHRNKYGVDEETSSPWGNAAFKLHVKLCQQAASESEKRELVRARFRACLLLTTPFILRIKADGTLTVQDLVERTDLNKLGMPPALLSQLEALLSTAISLSVQSKVVPTVRDHLSTSSEIFMVPMVFDPKFQRGPFDPYGRAPRIFPRLKLKGTQPNKHGRSALHSTASSVGSDTTGASPPNVVSGDRAGNGNDDDDDDDDDDNGMPLGLWDKKQKKVKKTLAASQAKKLFGFQSDFPVNKSMRGEGVGAESALPIDTAVSLPQTDNGAGAGTGTGTGSGGHGGEGEGESGRRGSRQGSKQRSKKEMHNRARALKHDFEAHVRSGFERPYTCSHPGCDSAFSRAYSLTVHEKSHELFGGYHKFRRQPQLFLDPDVEDVKAAARAAFEASVSLPPLVQQEIYNLRAAAAAKAWALTYDEQERMREEAEKPPSSRPTTAQLFGPELVFPKTEAPAVRAVNELPSSRGNELLPATPGSPWRLPRAKGLIDSPMSTPNRTPRAGSRGGMFSRGGLRSPTAPHMAITPWDQQWPDAEPGIGSARSSFPNTPLGSPSRSAAGTSRGSVTWADQVDDDDDVPLLSAPPIRFGMGLGPVDDD